MKAFLLAAGHGTRLRPITDTLPKCLVSIRDIPMLSIWLRRCEQFGIDEVLINIHAHADQVRDFVGKNHGKVDVRVVEESVLLGSAGTLRANQEWITRDEPFWIFYADVLTCVNLHDMLAAHLSRKPAATLGVYTVPDPTRCGIVTVDEEGIVQQFVEKPKTPESNLAFSGLMIGTREIFKLIPGETPCDIGFHLLPQLVGRMLAFPISEYLIDIGAMRNYLDAQTSWPGLSET